MTRSPHSTAMGIQTQLQFSAERRVGKVRPGAVPSPEPRRHADSPGCSLAFLFQRFAQSSGVPKAESRLQVLKTYKLFIGGKFVRGENGRVIAAQDKRGQVLANFSRASKKDFRDAVLAARSAVGTWSKQSAYLRGQILYRAAEMLEMRRAELQNELARTNGTQPSAAEAETTAAIDRLVHYAGWTDKFSQVFGSVNPVASSHFNFTTPEPTGVVVVVCPDEPGL